MLERLINGALRFRLLVLALVGALVVAGLYAYSQLPIEAFPDVNDKQVVVITQSPGQSPEEMEQQISLPIERELNGIEGETGIRSTSMFALSVVTVTFGDATDLYFAREQVNERLGGLALPGGVQPVMQPMTDALGEIYRYTIEAPPGMSLNEQKSLEDWVVEPALRAVPGVADVNGFGGTVKQYQIRLDPNKLLAYGVTATQVMEAVTANNANAGGSIVAHGDEAYTVRGIGLARSLDDLGQIVVSEKGGAPILVRDLGTVTIGHQQRLGIVAFDRRDDVVEGIVDMRLGANPSVVCAAVQKAIDDLNAHALPPGVKLVPYYDRRDLVAHTLHTVAHNLAMGAALVFAILLVFLMDLRCSVIVAAVIPLSLLFAFTALYLRGIPANLLSLGAVDFGIIIDGAVVMVEAIFVRLLARAPAGQAVSRGDRAAVVREVAFGMGRPILFSKLIIICALIPVFTFQRVEGRIFAPMAWTLGAALVGSLLLTLTLVPVLAVEGLGKPLAHRPNRLVEGLGRLYVRALAFVLRWRRATVAAACVLLVGALLVGGRLGTEFLPKLDEGNIWLDVDLPTAASMDETHTVEQRIRAILRSFPEVTRVVSQLGRPDDGTDTCGFNHLEIAVDLADKATWPGELHQSKERLIEQMNQQLRTIPGADFTFSQYIEDNVNTALSGVKGDIAVKLYGPDLTVLNDKAHAIAAVLARVPGVADLGVEQQFGQPQVAITVDRAACARRGLNVQDVMDLVQGAIGGKAVSTFYEGDRRYDVVVRLDSAARDAIDKIAALELVAPDGQRVRLSEVTRVAIQQGAARIERESNMRMAAIKCSVRGRDQGGFVRDAQAAIARAVPLPPGYQLAWEGQFENQQRAMARLAVVVPICLLLIFGLLTWAFRGLRNATLVMANVPFALIGGLVGLAVAHLNLSVSAVVGFIALFGVSVENGVILVSQIDALQRSGIPKRQAIREGAQSRLRPVVMTALMAGLGLLPAAVSTGIGSEVQRPLAMVIVCGLLSATVLTLLVLPVIYDLCVKAREPEELRAVITLDGDREIVPKIT